MISELDDMTQVQKKPKISKKADMILQSKQNGLFKWLFNRVSDGSERVSFETFKFDLASTEVLACIM